MEHYVTNKYGLYYIDDRGTDDFSGKRFFRIDMKMSTSQLNYYYFNRQSASDHGTVALIVAIPAICGCFLSKYSRESTRRLSKQLAPVMLTAAVRESLKIHFVEQLQGL